MSANRSAGLLFGLFLVAGCGSDATTPEPSQARAAIQSGDQQTGTVGQPLTNPAVVRVSQDGTAVAGTNVTWSVTGGGGSVSPTTSTTDAAGNAMTAWTLGATPGANTLEATVSSASGSPVLFSASGTPASLPNQASVTVGDNFFDATSVTVAAGGSITWTWAGAVGHNVTFPTGPNSSTQASGMFSRTFAAAGSFDYLCTIHGAAMSGTIVVQ